MDEVHERKGPVMHPILKRGVEFVVRNSPRILATIGVCGVVGTSIMTAKATPEVMRRIDELEFDDPDDKVEVITKKVKAAAPVYAPAIGMGALTIASFLGSQHILTGRQASAAIAASVAETALKSYQDAAIETVGKAKHNLIMDEVAKKRLPKIIENNKNVELPGEGETIFADCQTGRMFRSTIERVRQAEAEVSRLMTSQFIVTLNDFYEIMGLGDVDLGDNNGWIIDRGDQFEINFTYEAHPVTEEPVTVINYNVSYLGRV